MKKSSLLFTICVCIFSISIFTACSSDTPGNITMSIFEQMKKGNYEKAIDILYNNSEKTDVDTDQQIPEKEMIKALAEKAKQGMERKGGIKDVELVSENIDDDQQSATVTVRITYKDDTSEEQNMDFKKVDNQWKIDNRK